MKVVELLKIGRELLKVLSENEVRTGDWKYVKMYEEYRRMRDNGVKYRAAVMEAATRHGISRANAERIIKRMGKEL